MKREFHGKVLGHELFRPDPKDSAEAVLVKVHVAAAESLGKPRKAVLPVPLKDLGQFPTGAFLRITVQDSQQELPLHSRPVTSEMTQEELGEPAGTAGRPALEVVRDPNGGRRRRRGGPKH